MDRQSVQASNPTHEKKKQQQKKQQQQFHPVWDALGRVRLDVDGEVLAAIAAGVEGRDALDQGARQALLLRRGLLGVVRGGGVQLLAWFVLNIESDRMNRID